MVRLPEPEKIQHSTDPGRDPFLFRQENRFLRAVAFIVNVQALPEGIMVLA